MSNCVVFQEWQASTDLKLTLYTYLRKQVPRIFCQKEESNPNEEEEQVERFLLHPLEYFLFGEDPDEGVKKLKQGSSSSQLCGRVFKEGETVYSCRFQNDLSVCVTNRLYTDVIDWAGIGQYFAFHAKSVSGCNVIICLIDQ